mgnify:CR=1 FL=1
MMPCHPLTKFLGTVAVVTLVSACSTNPVTRIFDRNGGETAEVPESPDDGRIAAVALEQSLEPDPRFDGMFISVPPAFANTDWSQPGGEPDHVMHHLSGPETFRFAWSSAIGDGGDKRSPLVAPPVVADGRVFTLDAEAKVSAFRVDNGNRLWDEAVAPDIRDGRRRFWRIGGGINPAQIGFGGGVAVDGDQVFMVNGFAQAAAFNVETGEMQWEAQLSAPVRNPPTAVNGKIYVITTSNQVVALDQTSGETVWTHESFEENARFLSTGSVAVDGDIVVVPFSSGEVVALDVDTGRVLWTATVARSSRMNGLSELNDIAGSPVVDRGAVFAVSHSGQLSAIDGRTGRLAWEKPISGLNMPWVAGDYLFVMSTEAELIALSREDGGVVWKRELDAYENMKKRKNRITWSGPILAGEQLIVTSSAGRMLQLSPQDGSTANEYKLKSGTTIPPVIADGTVFIINDKARLEAWR